MNTPVFYLYLQFKIAEHSDNLNIKRKDIIDFFRHYHIPKSLRNLIIEEMKTLRLLEDDGIRVRIINCGYHNRMDEMDRLTRRRLIEKEVLALC